MLGMIMYYHVRLDNVRYIIMYYHVRLDNVWFDAVLSCEVR